MLPPEMYHQEFKAPEELQDTIKCFWYNRRDSEEAQSDFEVVPDGYAEIIFHFGGECSISYNGTLQPLPSPFMIGLLNQPVIFQMKNRLEIIAIRCFPWTVFDLLGLPSGKVEVHTFEHPIAQLHSTLNTLIQNGRVDEAIEHVKEYFLNAHKAIAKDSMLFKAGIAMTEAKGTLPVSQVAQAAHATVRTLERKFKESSGHTVKDVSGLMRFEQARNHLWLHPETNIAGLAIDLGYTDQSHLSREFKRYSGITPAAFARKAKKRRQMVSDDFVAFIQA
ncbi:helix-turn-helix domain-containing protein [Chryseobacterium sp. ISL-6]|uniref:helix-turn-helix domain-containing protein n=1 Tax=Chryseobacterium sp. ISL-6 TaxID=2819143 RepID=UPI001BE7B224|nr:helix-turn-helix domain-containing protein [Chryseobacterium sp. ISL-6]MBT2619426.1 AraC family transcriptional regulator [Chryseobacterium sp. ISL-6]